MRPLIPLVFLALAGARAFPAEGAGAPAPTPPSAAPTGATSAPEDPGEEGRFAAERTALLGRPLPRRELTSLTGLPMPLAPEAGRFLLVVFVDRDSREEAIAWLETYAPELARMEHVRLSNILFPGGVAFVVPRAMAAKQIRKDVERIQRRARDKLPPELQPGWDRLEIAWHIDWTRKLTRDFAAPRHRLSLYVTDPAGTIVAVEDRVDRAALERVIARVAAR